MADLGNDNSDTDNDDDYRSSDNYRSDRHKSEEIIEEEKWEIIEILQEWQMIDLFI